MDNYAKIQMKKLIFTLTLAFATVCGFAHCRSHRLSEFGQGELGCIT